MSWILKEYLLVVPVLMVVMGDPAAIPYVLLYKSVEI